MISINTARAKELEELQTAINYRFEDIGILNNALTHSSFIGNKNDFIQHNERLEFIGDSILNMVVSLHLYSKCKSCPEGQLTRIRASVVCETSLYKVANMLNLGKYLLLSKGEENTGGRTRVSILADAAEALIAAIYLDGGIKKARAFVLKFFKGIIEDSVESKIFNDYKSYLQEYVQKSNIGKLDYKILSEAGPDHNKTFEMALYLNNNLVGVGKGHSKKDAHQAAAKNAIEALGVKYE